MPDDVGADVTMRVRMLRRQRGLTLKALADRAELTESYLSKVERGQSVPSISVALRLAAALDVEVGTLFGAQDSADVITVVRADERTALAPPRGRGKRPGYEGIATGTAGKAMLPFVVTPAPAGRDTELREHTGEELVFVHVGAVLLRFADHDVRLETGDAAYFRGGVPHRLVRAPGASDAQALVVISRDPSELTDVVPPHD